MPTAVKRAGHASIGVPSSAEPRPGEVSPEALAEMILNAFVASTDLLFAERVFDPAVKRRYETKRTLYRHATVLLALLSEERRNSRLLSIRVHVEAAILPPKPSDPGAMGALEQLRRAMDDLREILRERSPSQQDPFVERKPFTWAMNWLREVGIAESNPATLILFYTGWMDAYCAVVECITSVDAYL